LQNREKFFSAQYVKRDKVKTIIAILASIYFLSIAFSPDGWTFLNYVNLIFHEAGHFLFIPFGYFLTIAGGTLLQLIIPAVLVGYFFVKRNTFAAALLLFWLGQSLLDVYVYAADALVMKIPLLGGDNTEHDWNIMFIHLGLLGKVDVVSTAIRVFGTIVILLAIYFSLKAATRKDRMQ